MGNFLSATPLAISDTGLIVGIAGTDSQRLNQLNTVYWDQFGALHNLGRTVAPVQPIVGINSQDQFVFKQWRSGQLESYLFNQGTITQLPFDCIAGINNQGHLLGLPDNIQGLPPTLFLYTSNGNPFTPEQPTQFFWGSLNTKLNDQDIAILNYFSFANPLQTIPEFWQDGNYCDLNSLLIPNADWQLTYAADIASDGSIIGSGLYQGQPASFLLTPVDPSTIPEPGSCSLLIFGYFVFRKLR